MELNLALFSLSLIRIKSLPCSSGVVWEYGKKKRFKALKNKQCVAIETAFQQYQTELIVGKKPKSRQQLEKMDVSVFFYFDWRFTA